MYLFDISVNLRVSGGNYTIFPALPAINCVHFIIVWFQSTLANFVILFLSIFFLFFFCFVLFCFFFVKQVEITNEGHTPKIKKSYFLFVKQACPYCRNLIFC